MLSKHQPEPIVQRSPGLSALCKLFQGEPNWNILELGPARGGNIDFWSRFGHIIHVADLGSNLPLPVAVGDEEPVEPEWGRLLGLTQGRFFDIILTWDLLNYLELTNIAGLRAYLVHFCKPGSILYSLVFDQPSMPGEPTVYQIMDEEHLCYKYRSSNMIRCPRHQPRTLAGIMRGFSTANSFRLRNGTIEYLFAYEEAESLFRSEPTSESTELELPFELGTK